MSETSFTSETPGMGETPDTGDAAGMGEAIGTGEATGTDATPFGGETGTPAPLREASDGRPDGAARRPQAGAQVGAQVGARPREARPRGARRREGAGETVPPRISIVVPVWNRRDTVARAVDSVHCGAHRDVEIIVVDDGSTDGSAKVAAGALSRQSVATRLIRQRNAGPGAARNTGAQVARGTYLAFLDSDDRWSPAVLDRCFRLLDSGRAPALVFLQTEDVRTEAAPGRDLSPREPLSRETLSREISSRDLAGPNLAGRDLPPADGPPRDAVSAPEAAPAGRELWFPSFLAAVDGFPAIRYATCNVLVRRDVFERLGGFVTDVRHSEDTDFFLRAQGLGDCAILTGETLVSYRVGAGDGLTGSFLNTLAGLRYILKRDREGAYRDLRHTPALKRRFFAKAARHAILAGFAAGEAGAAYGLFLRHGGLLIAGRNWRALWRLPLEPAARRWRARRLRPARP